MLTYSCTPFGVCSHPHASPLVCAYIPMHTLWCVLTPPCMPSGVCSYSHAHFQCVLTPTCTFPVCAHTPIHTLWYMLTHPIHALWCILTHLCTLSGTFSFLCMPLNLCSYICACPLALSVPILATSPSPSVSEKESHRKVSGIKLSEILLALPLEC